MEYIKFDDTCEILRPIGTVNEYDEPDLQTIYKGECLYEEGRSNIYGVITLRPSVYIPMKGITECVNINDIVRVETWSGRKIESLVKVPRDIKLRLAKEVKVTRLELKQAMTED